MKSLNLVTLTFQHGQDVTLEAFILVDMINVYQKTMSDRQVAISERLRKLDISDVPARMESFKALCREHDDSQIRLHGVRQVDKILKEGASQRTSVLSDVTVG